MGRGEEGTPPKASRGAVRMHPQQDASDLPRPALLWATTGRWAQGRCHLPHSWIRRLGIQKVSIFPNVAIQVKCNSIDITARCQLQKRGRLGLFGGNVKGGESSAKRRGILCQRKVNVFSYWILNPKNSMLLQRRSNPVSKSSAKEWNESVQLLRSMGCLLCFKSTI